MNPALKESIREADKLSVNPKTDSRLKANAYRGAALIAIELEDYDTAIHYGELALSFCFDEYVSDIQTIREYIIDKAYALKEKADAINT